MGRRNKKLAKLQQAKQAREFLGHKEIAPSLIHLPKETKRVEIAHACTLILSNPELQFSRLETLIELCNDEDFSIQALAISSLCSVFIDILPGYRIQGHDEEKIILSKETKAIRIYESSLLKLYQQFIGILVEKNSHGCIKVACRLLKNLYHFNEREKLLGYAIKNMHEEPEVVVDVIYTVLMSNELEFRFHAVRTLEKHVKGTSFKSIPERVIEILGKMQFGNLQGEDIPKKRQREGNEEEDKKKTILVQVRNI